MMGGLRKRSLCYGNGGEARREKQEARSRKPEAGSKKPEAGIQALCF
jgi:hypothetical protein